MLRLMRLDRSLKRVACTALLACATLGSVACAAILGVDDRTLEDGPDGSIPEEDAASPPASADAAKDARPASSDAGADAADAAGPILSCEGGLVSTCAGCGAGTAACSGVCTSDCTNACDPATLGCFKCSGGTPSGTCEPLSADASCIANPNYVHCPCLTASTCPGANQVCVGNLCRTCGEPATAGEVCRDGTGKKECKPITDPDPTKRLRCK
jgi:hypothetical protein